MIRTTRLFAVAAALSVTLSAAAQVEIETFGNGSFTNPFFVHDFEFNDPCCWELVERRDNFWLHLRPNTDTITFDLAPNQTVFSVSVTIDDFEGGIVGNRPTSAVIVRSPTDFVPLQARTIATPQVLTADINTPGRLTGNPLAEIVQIQFQAANQGNSVVPGVGAFFDDITITLTAGACPGDLNGDGVTDLADLDILLADFGCAP
jgi:hypothetical protein